MPRIVCTSDMHGKLDRVSLPEGDILVLAGDLLQNFYRDPDKDADAQSDALDDLLCFLGDSHFKHIVMIAGNHDWIFERRNTVARALLSKYSKITYLQDEGCMLDGLQFWGTPWQPEFCNWAFNAPRDGSLLRAAWAKIPERVDVLVTHGPPYKIMDSAPKVGCFEVGCKLLLTRVRAAKPRFHVFGHIHSGYGRAKFGETEFLNVALCDESYRPNQLPQVIDA